MKLSALILEEGDSIVIQGLECDIAAQGPTLSKAIEAFRQTVEGQMVIDLRQGKHPLIEIEAAPEMYWTKFRCGEPSLILKITRSTPSEADK